MTLRTKYQIEKLNTLLCQNVVAILNELNVCHRLNGEYITFPCPVHESRSNRSASVVISEYSYHYGTWSCWSRGCHERFGKTILGLIHGIQTTQNKCTVSKQSVIKWALTFLGLKSLDDIVVDDENTLKKKNFYLQSII